MASCSAVRTLIQRPLKESPAAAAFFFGCLQPLELLLQGANGRSPWPGGSRVALQSARRRRSECDELFTLAPSPGRAHARSSVRVCGARVGAGASGFDAVCSPLRASGCGLVVGLRCRLDLRGYGSDNEHESEKEAAKPDRPGPGASEGSSSVSRSQTRSSLSSSSPVSFHAPSTGAMVSRATY